MATINKKNEISKSRILRDLDLLLKIRHQEIKVCLANNLREKEKFYFKRYIFNSLDKIV